MTAPHAGPGVDNNSDNADNTDSGYADDEGDERRRQRERAAHTHTRTHTHTHTHKLRAAQPGHDDISTARPLRRASAVPTSPPLSRRRKGQTPLKQKPRASSCFPTTTPTPTPSTFDCKTQTPSSSKTQTSLTAFFAPPGKIAPPLARIVWPLQRELQMVFPDCDTGDEGEAPTPEPFRYVSPETEMAETAPGGRAALKRSHRDMKDEHKLQDTSTSTSQKIQVPVKPPWIAKGASKVSSQQVISNPDPQTPRVASGAPSTSQQPQVISKPDPPAPRVASGAPSTSQQPQAIPHSDPKPHVVVGTRGMNAAPTWGAVPTIKSAAWTPIQYVSPFTNTRAAVRTPMHHVSPFTPEISWDPPLSPWMAVPAKAAPQTAPLLTLPKFACDYCQRNYSVSIEHSNIRVCPTCLSLEFYPQPIPAMVNRTDYQPEQEITPALPVAPTDPDPSPSAPRIGDIKMYTQDSMTREGQFVMRSTKDVARSPEDEERREAARVKRQKLRARTRGPERHRPVIIDLTDCTSPETTPPPRSTPPRQSTPPPQSTARRQSTAPPNNVVLIEDSPPPRYDTELPRSRTPQSRTTLSRTHSSVTPRCTTPEVDISSEPEEVVLVPNRPKTPPRTQTPRRSKTPARQYSEGECRRHGDPNCTELECVDDFFEEYDSLDNTAEMAEIARRSLMKVPNPEKPQESKPEEATAKPVWTEADELAYIGHALAGRDKRFRRPYISHTARRYLAHNMRNFPFPEAKDLAGTVLHVGFTAAEVLIVCEVLGLGPIGYDDDCMYALISKYASNYGIWRVYVPDIREALSGRTEDDITRFIHDCIAGKWSQDIIDIPRNHTSAKKKPMTIQELSLLSELGRGYHGFRGGHGPRHDLELSVLDNLQPWKVFKQGASDVIGVTWSPDGAKFALCCVEFSDEYNRPGNLMLGDVYSSQVRMLDGHKVQAPGGDRHITVTGVEYSGDGQLLFSGSFDKTVRVWLGEDGAHLNTIKLEDEVSQLAISQTHDRVIAAACRKGETHVLSLDPYGDLLSSHAFPAPKPGLQSSALTWCNSTKPNWLLTGFSSKSDSGKGGGLVIYDAVAQKIASKVMPAASGHFDVYMDAHSPYFATAAIAGAGNRSVKTHVRLYNLAESAPGRSTRNSLECDSPQADINRVTLSPCSTYLTSSGTDGSTYVWDTRSPDEPLHILRHGATLQPLLPDAALEDADTGVTFAAWGGAGVDAHRLFTGGSDGVVKLWDVRRGDAFVRDVATLSASIMCGRFSPGGDMLLLGDCTGHATVLATGLPKGWEAGAFDVDIRDVNAEAEGDGEGREAARELVRSGRVYLTAEGAWAY
ncbi:hypothetical protein EDC01DRAFT_779606 [Geopyxis carbonaria]|nr:hypothetical protein EDC01DRAFT_779606 [Geopyxis carbonaria]